MQIELTLDVTPGEDSTRADHYRLSHRGKTLVQFYQTESHLHSRELLTIIRDAIASEVDHLTDVSERLKGRGQ